MTIIITGITNDDGSVSLPEDVNIPEQCFESICIGNIYYFFETEVERNQFYQERGL
jgi:hypothetical protein